MWILELFIFWSLVFLFFWCKAAWCLHNGNRHSWKNWTTSLCSSYSSWQRVQQMEGLASSSTFLTASMIVDWIAELMGKSFRLDILGRSFLLDDMVWNSCLVFLLVCSLDVNCVHVPKNNSSLQKFKKIHGWFTRLETSIKNSAHF